MTGKVKEGFGNITGDDSKKAEGKAYYGGACLAFHGRSLFGNSTGAAS